MKVRSSEKFRWKHIQAHDIFALKMICLWDDHSHHSASSDDHVCREKRCIKRCLSDKQIQ